MPMACGDPVVIPDPLYVLVIAQFHVAAAIAYSLKLAMLRI